MCLHFSITFSLFYCGYNVGLPLIKQGFCVAPLVIGEQLRFCKISADCRQTNCQLICLRLSLSSVHCCCTSWQHRHFFVEVNQVPHHSSVYGYFVCVVCLRHAMRVLLVPVMPVKGNQNLLQTSGEIWKFVVTDNNLTLFTF